MSTLPDQDRRRWLGALGGALGLGLTGTMGGGRASLAGVAPPGPTTASASPVDPASIPVPLPGPMPAPMPAQMPPPDPPAATRQSPPLIPARSLRRWVTGNRHLAPVSQTGAGLLFAGDRTLGLIAPDNASPHWVQSHGFPGVGAVFRPRAAGEIALAAGRQALGTWSLAGGEPRWRRLATRQFGVPCLDGEDLYCGDGHDLLALDLASGTERWRFAAIADTLISYAPVTNGELVLVGPGDGRLYALDRASGEPRWVRDGREEWQYLRQLHLAGNTLVAGGYKEKLYGIDLASGAIRWTFNAGNFINSQHLAGDSAYLWSPTGWLYAISITHGEVRWRHQTAGYRGDPQDWGALMAELTTAQGHLYALDLHQVLHVLSLDTGREIARYPLPQPVRPFILPLGDQRLVCGTDDGDLWLLALDPPSAPGAVQPGSA